MDNLIEKYNKTPIKADIYSTEQIKIALDDVLIEYCQTLGHEQCHTVGDFSNAVGVVSTIIACGVVGASYLWKFNVIKDHMIIAIYVYFIINIISYLFCYFKGGKIDFKTFKVATNVDQTPSYNVLIHFKGKEISRKYNKCVYDLFDDACTMDHELFIKDLVDVFKN